MSSPLIQELIILVLVDLHYVNNGILHMLLFSYILNKEVIYN